MRFSVSHNGGRLLNIELTEVLTQFDQVLSMWGNINPKKIRATKKIKNDIFPYPDFLEKWLFEPQTRKSINSDIKILLGGLEIQKPPSD